MLSVFIRLCQVQPSAAAFVLSALIVPAVAQADPQDTLTYSAGLTHQHDSNLFRLPDGVDPLPRVGKSARDDRITSGSLGIGFKKAWSLQQLEAGFEHVSNRYANHDFLDHDINNARAAWRWQITPRLTGNLTANRTQALVGFGDYTSYNKKNLRTTTTYRFDGDWNMFRSGWHLRGGIDQIRTNNSQTFTQDEGVRSVSADGGVRYRFPSSNWIDVVFRSGTGSYLGRQLDAANLLDTGFRDRRADLRAYWMNGKSVLEGSIGYLAREYDHYGDRDFSGGTGSLKWTWTPTGKIALVMSWKRDLAAHTDAASSYYLRNAYSIAPVWQASSKVRLGLRFDRNSRDFQGAVLPTPVNARHEHINTAQLVAEWTPMRAVTVSVSLTEDWRNANQSNYEYDTRIAAASIRLDF